MRRSGISIPGSVAFSIALAFYAATLLPGVAYWDTGEMQTVPYILGIAHPTGFPLFVLGGWLFSHGFAFGTPAWRLSLFSALASAAATGCLAVFVADLVGDGSVGIAGAVVFALGDVAWTRAVRAEVHDLALFWIALALVAAGRASAARSESERTSGWALGVTALASGLGLATHPVVALALPGIVFVAWPALAAARPRTLAAAFALLVVPLVFYAYVPVRSAFVEAHGLDPAAAAGVRGGAFWDDDAPSTPGSFVRYVSGANFEPGRSVAAAFERRGAANALVFAKDAAYREYGALILAFALCGFTYLAVRRPFVAAGLAAIALADVAFAANFTAESDAPRYLLAGFWAAAACAAVGAWWVAHAIAGERPLTGTVLASALILGGLWPNVEGAARDLARERRLDDARAFGGVVARHTAPGSLVLASWTFAAPLAYDAYVAGTFAEPLVCGWPSDEAGHFAAWRARFGHVYFVLPPRADVAPFAHRVFATDRYQIAELDS